MGREALCRAAGRLRHLSSRAPLRRRAPQVRILHLRVVVLSDPLLIQAVVSRAADLPKAHQLYDAVDEVRCAV
jgi:hypothetical protein